MLTPIEIYKTFAPYICIPKNGNIIYQNKKIFIRDTGILIFDMDLGDTEDIFFPNTIFNTILKAKQPTFKKLKDKLIVESISTSKSKKVLEFNYFKLDNNPIELPTDYTILQTLQFEEIESIIQYSSFIQQDSDSHYSGIYEHNGVKYFASGSKSFSYLNLPPENIPQLNFSKNFVFQSMEEGTIEICIDNNTKKHFYKIYSNNFTCILPIYPHKIVPKNIFDKYPIITNEDNFIKIDIPHKQFTTAIKEITTDLGKLNLNTLELDLKEYKLNITITNSEKIKSSVEIEIESNHKFYIRFDNILDKDLLSAFTKYKGDMKFMIPVVGSIGKLFIIEDDINFICTYNELII